MIVGIGVDVADVARFERTLARTPAMAERLFTPAERVDGEGRPRSAASLAARFAAKEAAAKALGAPAGLRWTDAEVVSEPSGRPALRVTGTVQAHAERLGVRTWHLSLSHDGGIATAMVIAED
ncbi:holo-ACP synthase [Allostreptomyces psammosilenae]|uniref:Holo-[acyl-carrier-protein] synthase n=1 Tax=Allostreptomyces psammosilenae TaxID=1892865 RepID=A0A853A640_9ACTN|nr:holo-ACP synthase [Allostreptomyces psammosilenae]NYI05942.1 holo-[acyl-carrier protein] synthase [Allostreptomyces psammosilenae]